LTRKRHGDGGAEFRRAADVLRCDTRPLNRAGEPSPNWSFDVSISIAAPAIHPGAGCTFRDQVERIHSGI